MARNILKRAVSLQVPGLVLEFELLPAMTEQPEWGAELTALLHRHLRAASENSGLRCALRVTPTDIRDQGKHALLRTGPAWEKLRRSFELCRDAGADILSIESVGGKEVHDQALMYGNIPGIIFALGVLAPRDMAWLWDNISSICGRGDRRVVPGGDTACGFAKTAMQLAHQKMLPEVLAAVVRAMSAARSLVAFEHGAIGPSKDCAYEGPVIKAITGCPIAMEGKSATCAHFSPLGNIAAAMCDLWSNESVQNVRLLSGNAPEAYAETLAYDCRLMNVATARNQALTLRDWLTESDEWLSPQAAMLSPRAVCRIANAIVSAPAIPVAGPWPPARLRWRFSARVRPPARSSSPPRSETGWTGSRRNCNPRPPVKTNFWARCRRRMASSSWRQAMACKRQLTVSDQRASSQPDFPDSDELGLLSSLPRSEASLSLLLEPEASENSHGKAQADIPVPAIDPGQSCVAKASARASLSRG